MKTSEKNKIKKVISKELASGNASVSSILSKIDIAPIISIRRTFSPDSMAKAIIFRDLRKIKSNRKLAMYLINNVDDRRFLGFDDRVPTHQEISHFESTAFKDYKDTADYIRNFIMKISEKYEIDIAKEKDIIVIDKDSSTNYLIKMKKEEMEREALEYIIDKMKLQTKRNSKYKTKDHLKTIFSAAVERGFLHGVAESLRERGYNTPVSQDTFYMLSKMSEKSIKAALYSAFDDVLRRAKSRRMFAGRKFDVAVDYTLHHFYGKKDVAEIKRKIKNDLGIRVIERYEDRGTRKYLGFITLSIVEKNYRFVLYAIPVFDNINKAPECELLKELIEKARKYIDIRYLYADRGFPSAENFRMLDSLGIKYIIPLPDNNGIKRILSYGKCPFIVNDFERGGYKIKSLCIINGSRGKMKLATNMQIKKEDLGMLSRLPRLYSKRWGIETGYRVMKRGGTAITTSRNYSFRLFFFMTSVLLYNIWVLLNISAIVILGLPKDGHYAILFKSLLKRFGHFIDIT